MQNVSWRQHNRVCQLVCFMEQRDDKCKNRVGFVEREDGEGDGDINRSEEGRMNAGRPEEVTFILDIRNRIFVWGGLSMSTSRWFLFLDWCWGKSISSVIFFFFFW